MKVLPLLLFLIAINSGCCGRPQGPRLIRVADHVQSCIGGTAYYEIELDR